MKDWVINVEHYQKLLRYVGVGDLPNADIIIFGNEEGTGGNPIYANLEARERYFGKKSGEDSYTYTIDPNGEFEKGFWNPSAIEGEKMVLKVMEKNGEELPKRVFARGGFLQYCSRICLANEDNENDIDYWFMPIGENRKVGERVRKYIREGLFQPRDGIQTFLMDWRPLPRPNEKWWGREYSEVIDKKSYLGAFNLSSSSKEFKDLFSNYSDDVKLRKEIFKNAILLSKAKVLIGLGTIDIKKNFIKGIFDLTDNDFEDVNIDGAEVKAIKACKRFDEKSRELFIYLLPFPIAGHGAFNNGDEMNALYKEVTKQIKSCL